MSKKGKKDSKEEIKNMKHPIKKEEKPIHHIHHKHPEHSLEHHVKPVEQHTHHVHHHPAEHHENIIHHAAPEHHVHHKHPHVEHHVHHNQHIQHLAQPAVAPMPEVAHKVHHHNHPHIHHEHHEAVHGTPIEKALVENMVQLQKVHTDLAEKFDKLTKEISGLLSLFEMTARSFGDHPAIQASEKDKAFLDKIDKLLDQNKLIAKGLTMMDERMRERIYGGGEQPRQETNDENMFKPSMGSKPLPRF
ncbi:hypothetical protein KW787_03585 [Candidatus Pacearchaeota archaeon]|nr:hypothetical protein [Candidatus Pacearchaeota archaeon]